MKRLLSRVILFSATLLMVGIIFYSLMGHRIVEAMYQGKSIPALNRIISHQKDHPISFYLEKADHLIAGMSIDLLVYLAILGIFLWVAKHKKIKLFVGLMVVALLLSESFLYVLLDCPGVWDHIPAAILSRARPLYDVNRHSITYDPAGGRYDPELTYTLKPGSVRFQNREFDTHYQINSLGVRDDEESLAGPEIVVLGDSFAMGWGVEQDETFASVVEKETGLKTLNAGIASYGTVREMRMLKRIDTSKLKHLLIEYCGNDDVENHYYSLYGGHLPVMPEGRFLQYQEAEKQYRYYPFRYTLNSIAIDYFYLKLDIKKKLLGNEFDPAGILSNGADSVKYFLDVILKDYLPHLEQAQIIVLGDKDFCAAFEQVAGQEKYPSYIQKMVCVDSYSQKREDYFRLDGHWNARGHRVAARRIMDAMKN